MANQDTQTFSYREFSDYVRKFDRTSLLEAAARASIMLPDQASDSDPSYIRTAPWALAAIVKASICNGNPFRHTVLRPDTIGWACHMYNNLEAEELQHPEIASAYNIMVRITYEQFPYQEPLLAELGRAEALFSMYSGRKQQELQVINDVTLTKLLGAPLRSAAGVAILLHTSAIHNNGYFDIEWLNQDNFKAVLHELPQRDILAVIDNVFSTDFDEFRQQMEDFRTTAGDAAPSYLERYLFNPLTAKPLLKMPDKRLLMPVRQIVGRRISPIELYYLGIKELGDAFASDMGELFEDYVGRQLYTIPKTIVYSEIVYHQNKSQLKSVDWIVVFDDLVLLVEAKAGRLSTPARAGGKSLDESVKRSIGKAFDQIDRTRLAIINRVPEFSRIPTDRPFFGVIASLDPWNMTNALAGNLLPKTNTPTTVSAVQELECLVALSQRINIVDKLVWTMDAGKSQGWWSFNDVIRKNLRRSDNNPIITEAWKHYPFTKVVST